MNLYKTTLFGITGNIVNSFIICPRKAWLYSRQLSPTCDSDLMEIGKLISKETFKREKKELMINDIKIDIISKDKESILVGEVKKSTIGLHAAKMQLLFYMLKLKSYGIETSGFVLIPKEKKKIEVKLTDKEILVLETLIKDIQHLVLQNYPPLPKKSSYCKNCSYFEFCWS